MLLIEVTIESNKERGIVTAITTPLRISPGSGTRYHDNLSKDYYFISNKKIIGANNGVSGCQEIVNETRKSFNY